MGRETRGSRRGPLRPKPVEKIELNEQHAGRRLALSIALLVFGVGLAVFALVRFLSPDRGWNTIEPNGSAGVTCGEEFVFLYPIGESGHGVWQERREITEAYTALCLTAYRSFHNEEEFAGMANLCTLNRHPNETFTVEKALYDALETMERSGSRALYLGPVYNRYDDLFFCTDDAQLVDFDPRLSEEVRLEYEALAALARDEEAVKVELLGENQVRLHVSQAYLAFAQEEGVDDFIDFSWMKNAFIIDYLAQGLMEQGYCRGAISSYDGFVRNLDSTGTGYALQLYDRQGKTVYPAAVMEYRGPMSIVTLRDYPMNDLDRRRFYELAHGEIRSMYLDIADGMCRSALPNLVCYSGEAGCGEILAKMLPVYIADQFDREALGALEKEGIQSITFREGEIFCSDQAVALGQLYDKDGVTYRLPEEPGGKDK